MLSLFNYFNTNTTFISIVITYCLILQLILQYKRHKMTKAEIIQYITSNQWLVTAELAQSFASLISSKEGISFEEIKKRRAAYNRNYATMIYSLENGAIKAYEPKADMISSNGSEGSIGITSEGIAIVHIKGVIQKDSDYCTKGTDEINAELLAMGTDERVKGVLLVVDSGGGQVAGTETLANTVLNYNRRYGKRIEAFVDGMAGSAAYWIISGCDKIYLSGNTTAVGSIGTMATIANTNAMYESVGIKIENIYATLSKNKNLEYEEALNGNFEPMRLNILDKLNTVFLRSVIRGRYLGRYTVEELTTENTPEQLTGKVYFGLDAINIGLADSINTKENALALFEARIKRNNAVGNEDEPINDEFANSKGDGSQNGIISQKCPDKEDEHEDEDEYPDGKQQQAKGLTKLKSLI